MAKNMVRYNGEKKTFYGCTEPDVLVEGEVYEVIGVKYKGKQENYILKGINGYFNASWFDEVTNYYPETFIAVAHDVPVLGEQYVCSKLEERGGEWYFKEWVTDIVRMVEKIGMYTYRVTTCRSVIIVEVR